MYSIFQAITRGLRSALHFPTLLPLWISTFILGWLQSWPIWLAGEQLIQRPFLGQLASGGTDMLVDLFLKNDSLSMQAPIWLSLQIPILIIQHIMYAICAGGMLSVYLANGEFASKSRRFALPFIGLDILLTILLVIIISLGAAGVVIAKSNVWIIPALVMIILLGIIGEYARAIAVVRDRRNPFVIFGQALSFCIHHFAGVALLAIISSIMFVLVLFGYSLIPSIAGLPWLALVLQQMVIFVIVWIKALRLAWAGQYVQATVSSQTFSPQ